MLRIDDDDDETVNTPTDNILANAFTERDPAIDNTNPISERRPPLEELENDNGDTNVEVEDTATEDMSWINPETTKNLIDIAVDILKQTIDNETQTMTSLVGIAVDILTKTIEARKDDKGYGFKGFRLPTLEYTLPKASVRFKDIIISTKHVNYYDSKGSPVTPPESSESDEQSPESNTKIISTIVPVYDGMNNVKITAYTIKDNENGDNEILDKLGLGDFNLEELKGENKTEKIQEIIKKLQKKYKIDNAQEESIKEYLGKLGEEIDNLKAVVLEKNE
uniref:Uncharacterized protein n=1 Tax=viral metagenome TaxID=1070528 RepID=A0A6C0D6M8_9ZZZZ